MVRKHRYAQLEQADEARTLANAAGILGKHVPAGREKQFDDARLLLLATAIKIRTERAKTAKEES